jgi:hypothetical protein
VDTAVTAQQTYSYTIVVRNSLGTASAGPVSVTTPMMPVNAPTIVSALPNNAGTSVTLRWTDNATNETFYWVDVSLNGAATTRTVLTRTAAQATQVGGALNSTIATQPGNLYTISVTAVNVSAGVTNTSAPATATVDLSVPALAAPATLVPGAQTATRAPFSWAAVTPPVTAPVTAVTYVVQVNTNGAVDSTGALVWTTVATTNTLAANPTIAAGNSYQFRVLTRATRFGTSTLSATPSQALPVVTAPAASTAVVAGAVGAGTSQVTVTWTNLSTNLTGWIVERRPNFGAARAFTVITPTSLSGTSPSYNLTDTVTTLGSYTYRITGLNGTLSGASAVSNNVVAQ